MKSLINMYVYIYIYRCPSAWGDSLRPYDFFRLPSTKLNLHIIRDLRFSLSQIPPKKNKN